MEALKFLNIANPSSVPLEGVKGNSTGSESEGLLEEINFDFLLNTLTKNNEEGTIFASGLITGEAIMGILIAVPIFITGVASWWSPLSSIKYNYLGFILFFIPV